jgi:Holliday junction resolvase
MGTLRRLSDPRLRRVLRDMSNPNYDAGVRLEREVMAIFKREGYEVARTAGSHGPWDVILLKRGRGREYEVRCLVLVQCKTRKVAAG